MIKEQLPDPFRTGESITVVVPTYPAHSVCRWQRHTECAGYILATLIDSPVIRKSTQSEPGGEGSNNPIMWLFSCFQLFACLLLLCGCGKPLDLDAARVFQDAEKTFTGAKSPDDYLKAAAMYQEILDRGQVSGAVLYNQGNALMRAGQRGRAIAAYRQARRYLGPDPFLEANLAYAVGNQPPVRRRPLVEYIFFWQDWISYPAKFQFAACSVGITFALAIAALFIHRRLLRRATLVGLFLSLVLILSAGYDWYRCQWNVHGVIVEKQTVVRKGNAESYEPALTAALEEGAEFDLVERRGDWILIRLPGDQEGWLPDRAAVLY